MILTLFILFYRAWFVSIQAYGKFKSLCENFSAFIYGFKIEMPLGSIQIRVAPLLILTFKKQSPALHFTAIFVLLPTN